MTSGRTPPSGRYPAEASPTVRRRWLLALSVVVVAAGLGIAYLGYTKFSEAPVSGEATGYQIIDDSAVDVQYTVSREDPRTAVACVVRARSRDGSETGRREVLIPPGDTQQVALVTRVRTSAPPAIGEVFGCTVSVPPYLTESDGN